MQKKEKRKKSEEPGWQSGNAVASRATVPSGTRRFKSCPWR